ncbi:MAG TPA: wax ester/triacylglycerol synthase domain-containing protein [Acidimicrobiales bacterium]|nr:wax ester/triacylglycerol synthase domain-containing protein [Acidimicrobiales bacterium]
MTQRLSDAEAVMWAAESDPSLASSFMSVTFLDGPVDHDRFTRRIAGAVAGVDRMRQRIEPGPSGSRALWRDDPAFDLANHIHREVLAGADDRALLDHAGQLLSAQFDHAHPLWDIRLVEGLSDGRSALLAKFHHTVTDGVGGVRLSSSFLDLSPDDDPVRPAPPPAVDETTLGASGGIAGLVATLTEAGRDAIRTPVTLGRAVLGTLRDDPIGAARTTVQQLVVTDRARSPIWRGHRSQQRHCEISRVPLDDVRTSAKALGGTINDLFVSAVLGGVARYHAKRDAAVDEFRVSIPLNTRSDTSVGGNAFVPARVLLRADVDPRSRFATVAARLADVKASRDPGLGWALAGLFTSLPSPLIVAAARQQIETVDFACSNVRGAPFPLYVSGARVLANHPMGPTGGTAANATVLSYEGSLDLGLVTDPAAVDAPEQLRELISAAFDELITVGRQ